MSRPAQPALGRSVADLRPDLVAEWHPENPFVPQQVSVGSAIRVKWLCAECGNEWTAAVGNRTAKQATGCPPCAFARRGRSSARPQPGRSLADLAPEIAAQWHPTENGDVRPDQVKAHSNAKRWWQCAVCHFVWNIAPAVRLRGCGCPACAGRQPTPTKNLAVCHPDVAAWWHSSRNGDVTPDRVTPGEGQPRWWQCPYGHEWQTTVSDRVRGTGCPKCSGWGTSRREQQILAELRTAGWPLQDGTNSVRVPGRRNPYRCDALIPAWKLIVEYDGWRYHKTSAQKLKDQTKTADLERAGWRVLRIREHLEPIGDHDVVVPIVKSDGQIPELIVAPVLRQAARLGLDLPMSDLAYLRDYRDRGLAPSAYIPGRPPKGLSLAEKRPVLITEWHPTKNLPMTPELLTARSGFRAWWVCVRCGYEWQRVVAARSVGQGCGQCAGQVTTASNCLAARRPDLAAQWHPTGNGALTPGDVHVGSGKRVWWLCARCGHSWRAQPYRRSREGTGCPECGRRVPRPRRQKSIFGLTATPLE